MNLRCCGVVELSAFGCVKFSPQGFSCRGSCLRIFGVYGKLWLFRPWDLQNLQRSLRNVQYTSTMILREGRSRRHGSNPEPSAHPKAQARVREPCSLNFKPQTQSLSEAGLGRLAEKLRCSVECSTSLVSIKVNRRPDYENSPPQGREQSRA